MSHVTFGAALSSPELAKLSDFANRRHIPRKAAKGEIPNAERTPGGHWRFRVTHNLRGWICFYRVRHTLLRKQRSWGEERTLRDWGTDWKYALETFDFFKAWPVPAIFQGGSGTHRLGAYTTWEAVEAMAIAGYMPRAGWRKELERKSGAQQ